jgi:hypothetical protein
MWVLCATLERKDEHFLIRLILYTRKQIFSVNLSFEHDHAYNLRDSPLFEPYQPKRHIYTDADCLSGK